MELNKVSSINYDGREVTSIEIDGNIWWEKTIVPQWGRQVSYVASDGNAFIVTEEEHGSSSIISCVLSASSRIKDEGIIGIYDEQTKDTLQVIGKGWQGLIFITNKEYSKGIFLSEYPKNRNFTIINNPFEGYMVLDGSPFYERSSTAMTNPSGERKIYILKSSPTSTIGDTKVCGVTLYSREERKEHEFVPCVLIRDLTQGEYSSTTRAEATRRGCYGMYDTLGKIFYGNSSDKGKIIGEK